jgi:signal transduction histidine kinase
MKSAVHVLRQGAGDDPAIREELLSGISDEIDRLSPLLDDLAQLHAHVQGRVELHLQPTAVSEWLPAVLLPWRAAAHEKGLDWRMSIAPELPPVALDRERTAQVVGNLLSNAIKYTPAPGIVAVEAQATAGEVLISVVDSGPGIAAEEQERVFEPFFRSERERRFPQGLGLGLSIARELVAAHGGRLDLESAPGAGSRFTIHLATSAG